MQCGLQFQARIAQPKNAQPIATGQESGSAGPLYWDLDSLVGQSLWWLVGHFHLDAETMLNRQLDGFAQITDGGSKQVSGSG